MFSSKFVQRIVAVVTTTSFVMAAFFTPLSAAASPAAQPPVQVDPLVQQQIAAQGTTTFWVVLREKADLSPAFTMSNWEARGLFVYNRLQAVANQSQAGLRSLLEKRRAPHQPFWVVNTIRVTGDQALLDEISKLPEVEQIVADQVFPLPDPLPGQVEPGVNGIEWNIDRINAPQVWSTFAVRGEGIVVANIDTGIDYIHSAVVMQYRGNQGGGNFDHNYNWFDPSNICGNPSLAPCDNDGHGTHTMGTIVGDDGDPGINRIGVAPHARWIAAKGCETSSCSASALLASAQWILAPTNLNGQNPRPDLRPHVVNNSWSGGSGNPWYQGMVQAWIASGIFPAFANGNAGSACSTSGSPGDYLESYSAGAFDINNSIASFSSRGPSAFGGEIKPNIAAPGSNVRSSVPGNGYAAFSGTSMASPHVAGTVALIWSAAPAIIGDIATTRGLLDQTAIDTSDLQCGGTAADNNVWGEGRLDAFAAVSAASSDLIFANSFEEDDCSLSPWSSCVIDGGDLSFNSPSLLSTGSQSLNALIDDNNPIYVTSDHPNAESRYLVSFYFDPNSISMVSGDTHTIFGGYTGTSTLVLRVQFRRSSGNYQVQASLLNDGSTWNNSGWFTISDAPHQIEFDWRAATAAGANNGGLALWIDGVQLADLTAVDNDMRRIDRARLGAVAAVDTGTRGTYYFDEFESSRGGGGPEPTATLTINKTGTGSGTVTSSPAGIDCGLTCSYAFNTNTVVTLTATTDAGSTFTGWSGGGCSGTSTCTVTMTADTSVSANFDLTPPTISPWPMYGHDSAHTGYSPSNGPNSADFLWSYALGERAQDNASPVIGPDGTIYMPSEDGFFAINPNGTLKWSRWVNEITLTRNAPAVAADGTVYVTKWPEDELFALNPVDGTTLWSYAIGGASYGSPTIGADRTIYIGNAENPSSFYALNPNGTLKWRWDSGSSCWIESSAAIGSNGDVYFQHNCLGLVSLNSSGQLNWTYPGAGNAWNSPSVGPDGTIYMANSDHYFYAFNPNGTLKWRAPAENWMYKSSSAVSPDGSTIYQGDNGGVFYAFNATGTVKWQYDTGISGLITSAPALTANGIVYFTHAGGNLYALHAADGNLLWQYAIGSSSSSPAIGADGSLYVIGDDASNNAVLYAFECADGLCPVPKLAISKTGTGSGTVTSSPAGINCGSTCSYAFAYNTVVTLTATAASDSTFTGWSGGGCSGTSTCTVTMTADTSITANFDLSPTDLIFADGFESGDFSKWPASSCVTDGGDLSVSAAAKYIGNYGMQALLDDNISIYCTSDHPTAETRYLASFSFDPNSISMVSGDTHTIFGGYMGTSTLILRVQFRRSSGNYQVQASLLNDGSTWSNSGWFTISDAYHQIKFDWRAASAAGANNGGLTLWIDGSQAADLTGVDNDTRRIDRARLGAVAAIDTGTRGTYYFDEFESYRGDGGPVVVTADFSANPTSGTAPLTVSFTNMSQPTASITGYLWDFGDGSTSTETNPVHTYAAVGDYTVTLTAFAGSEQDTEIKTNYIHATPPNVSVVGVWTADGNWNPKTTFASGDPILWVIDVENTTGADAQIQLTYDARGPNGEQVAYWNGTITTSVGIVPWGLPGTIPSGMDGTHTFTGSGLYQGTPSQAQTTYLVTSPPTDLIFADGFESGSLWSCAATGGGDLSVTTGAALVGTYGLQAVINDNTALYVCDNTPASEPRYRARFYFDPNSISMASGDIHNIFAGRNSGGSDVLRVQFRFSSPNYQVRTQIRNDGGAYTNSSWYTLSDAAHFIEIDWQAASGAGANNGYISLWLDGTLRQTVSGIDNDTLRVDEARLGPLGGIDTGTRGTEFFDAFESRRQTYIGP